MVYSMAGIRRLFLTLKLQMNRRENDHDQGLKESLKKSIFIWEVSTLLERIYYIPWNIMQVKNLLCITKTQVLATGKLLLPTSRKKK